MKLVIDVGEMVTGALPEPVSATICGPSGASSVTVSFAVLVPDALGVKVTISEHWEPAGTDEGTMGQELVTPKSLLLFPVMATEDMFSGILCSLVSVTVIAALVVPSN